jgi:hypothetical protein
MIGQKFGKLLVIATEMRPRKPNGTRRWFNCQCECGNNKWIAASDFKSRNPKHCGCLTIKNEIGNRYGKLVIISQVGSDCNGRIFECLCDCGNKHIAGINNLRRHNVKSCGCIRRQNMQRIGKLYCKEKHCKWIKDKSYQILRKTLRTNIEYRQWRNKVYIRDNYTCQICSQRGGKLIAHHLYSFNKHVELRTEIANGTTVCLNCHKLFHKKYGNRDNTAEQFVLFKMENTYVSNETKMEFSPNQFSMRELG